jgi:citrate lyase subunit beta/citryl-CoA lyase
MKKVPNWPLRSFLFLPANREELVLKVHKFAPEAVILDLEDSVPEEEKPQARAAIPKLVKILVDAGIAPFVRINSFECGALDEVASSVCPGLRGFVIPKIENAAQVQEIDRFLGYQEGKRGIAFGSIDLIGLPETASGLRRAHEIAAASPRMKGLMTPVSGPVGADVARAVGYRATPEGLEQLYLASKIILDCRAAGALFPIGAIIGAPVDDLQTTKKLIDRAKSLGFQGLALIHPSHVRIANDALRPTSEEINYNQRLLKAFEAARIEGRGAFRFEGAMVDFAMLAAAKETVAEGERIEAWKAG